MQQTGLQIFFALGSVVAGVLLVSQTAINNHIRTLVGDPYRTATTSAVVTWMFSFLLLTQQLRTIYNRIKLQRRSNDILDENDISLQWWMFLGGLAGVLHLVLSVIVSSIVGFAFFFVNVVAGQLITSLILDTFGFYRNTLPALGSPFYHRPWQIFGTLLTIIGCLLMQNLINGSSEEGEGSSIFVKIVCGLLGMAVGIALPMQSAINKTAARALGSFIGASLASITFSVFCLVFLSFGYRLFVAEGPIQKMPAIIFHVPTPNELPPFFPSTSSHGFLIVEWITLWGSSGVLGFFIILLNAFLPGMNGMATHYICAILGQLSLSLWIDSMKGIQIDASRIIGIVLVITGAVIVQIKDVSWFKHHLTEMWIKISGRKKDTELQELGNDNYVQVP